MKVNHIIIGAGRSGTTSLVEYLKQHPDINFSSIKEVTYFSVDDHYKRGGDFLNSFYDAEGIINATSDTYLLMSKEAPRRISNYNPDIKIAVILREPSSRTYSNYNFSINHGYIKPEVSLLESYSNEKNVLQNGDIIQQNNYCNFDGSLYYKHLSYWSRYFKKEQLFICTTDELKNNPQELMDRYFQFLGLDSYTIKEIEAKHKAAGVKNKQLNNFLVNRDHWLRKVVRVPLRIGFVRKMILNSEIVDKMKESNKEELSYKSMTTEEKTFCDNYFSQDLKKLKKEFGISFQ